MRKERGASLVETALILPFLLLFMLGVIDISRAYFEAAKVQEAAQEGAIYASLHPGDPDETIARTEETISSTDFTGSVTVTCPSNTQVTVSVAYTFDMATPFISNMFGPTLDLSHSETAHVLSSDVCTPSS